MPNFQLAHNLYPCSNAAQTSSPHAQARAQSAFHTAAPTHNVRRQHSPARQLAIPSLTPPLRMPNFQLAHNLYPCSNAAQTSSPHAQARAQSAFHTAAPTHNVRRQHSPARQLAIPSLTPPLRMPNFQLAHNLYPCSNAAQTSSPHAQARAQSAFHTAAPTHNVRRQHSPARQLAIPSLTPPLRMPNFQLAHNLYPCSNAAQTSSPHAQARAQSAFHTAAPTHNVRRQHSPARQLIKVKNAEEEE
uniref:Uncharacterized protein n=1 Tax=Globisporangium ultimum (strain ATCC 200006 / CBS 805.95 / DAOM BR144) TaxID=431595 RepID=K3XD84_GLOUD